MMVAERKPDVLLAVVMKLAEIGTLFDAADEVMFVSIDRAMLAQHTSRQAYYTIVYTAVELNNQTIYNQEFSGSTRKNKSTTKQNSYR